MAIVMFHSKCFGQWDNLYPKEKFTFSLTRIKTNDDTHDTLNIEKKSVAVVLDTIINLQNRRMFVFDKCLNGLLFNSSVELIKGKIKDKDYGTLEALYGSELIDGQQDFSDKQITIFYQVDSFIYVITMPKEFRKSVLKTHMNILKIDSLITNEMARINSDVFSIEFTNYNIPVSLLLTVNRQIDNTQWDGLPYSLVEIRQKEKESNRNGIYMYELYRRKATIGKLFFDKNWLIYSKSLVYTKKYVYYNIVDIKRN